jgi:hypothetical protein
MALLVAFMAGIASLAVVGLIVLAWQRSHRRSPSTHYGGIGRIREIGELVALRIDCADVAWAADKDRWFGRGRSLLMTCDMVVEYRFDMREAVISHTSGGIDSLMPECQVTVSHGDVKVVHMQHGTVMGLPVRRLDANDITRLLAEARENVNSKRDRREDYLAARAQDSARSMLLGYAGLIAPTETIRIVFAEPLDGNQSRHVAPPAVGQRTGLLEAASTQQALGFTGSPAIDLVTETRR